MTTHRYMMLSIVASCMMRTVARGQAPIGTEFQVNTYTSNDQYPAAVASDANGNFVVVWMSYFQDGLQGGIYGQRFASTGSAVGTEFRVNTYTTNNQREPSVASDANGNFVVVWQSSTQDGNNYGVFGQRFASSGNPAGTEFQVNAYTTNDQIGPTVASDANGNFVVGWGSNTQDGDGSGIFGQRFDSSGNLLGTEFQVNSYTTGSQAAPDVASDPSGDFVLVWESSDGSLAGVFGQRFDSSGNLAGTEFQVNTYTTNNQVSAVVASDATGNFVVAWQSTQGLGDRDIFGQRFDSGGNPAGTEFQVNSYVTSTQVYASIASDAVGDFIVVWQGAGPGDPFTLSVFGQLFDSSGSAVGSQFLVNTYTPTAQELPAVAMDPNGNFLVAWASNDPSFFGIFAQQFSLTPPPPAPSDTPTPTPTETPTTTPTSTGGPSLCPPTPLGVCRTASKSLLKIRNRSDDPTDSLLWKWIKGQSTTISEFGDPTNTADYTLCVYAAGAPVLGALIPAGAPKWSASGSGYKYKDAATANAGIKKVILKQSTTNSAKVVVSGKGVNLPDPTLELGEPVTAQLINSETSVCFTAEFAGPQILDNGSESFKGKAP